MARSKLVNGVLVALTSDEETQVNDKETAWTSGAASRKLAKLREERDRLLAETDWWAGSDLTMNQAQTSYRQALRDITDNATSLDDVTWPEKP